MTATKNAHPTVYTGLEDRNHFDRKTTPVRRVGALGLIRNERGEVLMCEGTPTHDMARPFYHPGGAAAPNEDFQRACERIILNKLGVTVKAGRMLVIHHMFEETHTDPATGKSTVSTEGINFIFDCGVLPSDTAFVVKGGLVRTHWLKPETLEEVVSAFTAQRSLAALAALAGDEVKLLKGHPKLV